MEMQIPDIWMALNSITHTLGGFLFCIAYVSGIVLLLNKNILKGLIPILAPVGRMALTNYLLHSIICTLLFLPYGLGLFGKVELWQGILLTLAIFGLSLIHISEPTRPY